MCQHVAIILYVVNVHSIALQSGCLSIEATISTRWGEVRCRAFFYLHYFWFVCTSSEIVKLQVGQRTESCIWHTQWLSVHETTQHQQSQNGEGSKAVGGCFEQHQWCGWRLCQICSRQARLPHPHIVFAVYWICSFHTVIVVRAGAVALFHLTLKKNWWQVCGRASVSSKLRTNLQARPISECWTKSNTFAGQSLNSVRPAAMPLCSKQEESG